MNWEKLALITGLSQATCMLVEATIAADKGGEALRLAGSYEAFCHIRSFHWQILGVKISC